MQKDVRDGIIFGIFGAGVGGFLGTAMASAYVTVQEGRKFHDMTWNRVLDYAPWVTGGFAEPFATAALIWLGCVVVCAIAMVAVTYRSTLSNYGSAQWAEDADLKEASLAVPLKQVSGPIFAKLGKPSSKSSFISSTDIPHSLIVAPTGSGKGVGIVIPTLLTYPGSIICLDPKGENFEKTARQRQALGDRVYKFEPLNVDGATHRFNPIEHIADLPEELRFLEAQRIANSLVNLPGDAAANFLGTSRDVLAAGICAAIECNKPTLGDVYDLLTPSEAGDYNDMFEALSKETDFEEAQKIFATMAVTADKTVSAYMSIMRDGGLNLWQNRLVRRATAKSDFSIFDLRRRPSSIFVIIAPNDYKLLGPLVRLTFQYLVTVLQQAEPKDDEPYPVLFLLDEFGEFGRMDVMRNAIATIRSYGGRFLLIVQTLAQLRADYDRDGAQIFMSNARLQLFMAPADEDTPEYVSRAIGDFTRKSRTKSWQIGSGLGRSNVQEREEGARLIRPEEVRSLSSDLCVLLVQGQNPVKAHKVRYYEDSQLKTVFESQTGPHPEAMIPDTERSLAVDKKSVTPNGASALIANGATQNTATTKQTSPDDMNEQKRQKAITATNAGSDIQIQTNGANGAEDASSDDMADEDFNSLMDKTDDFVGLLDKISDDLGLNKKDGSSNA